jgi:GNAT superfamily N-acetyltransferase
MEICEYDDVDPLDVLHLNLLCLDFALTPERAALIRQQDPRPFPFLALYARVGGILAGQVGVFRLPVVSTQGVSEVGGVWAVSTHPAFAQRGIASRLLDQAHERMRAAGLRFSTLGTAQHGVAHALYERRGYENVHSAASACIPKQALSGHAGLRAERAGGERLPLVDQLFERIARNHLGFARRHSPFFPFLDRRGKLSGQDVWLLSEGDAPAGYAVAFASRSMLKIANLLVREGADPVAAVAAIAAEVDAPYVQVRVDRLADTAQFTRAGFRLAARDWGAFMVKPLLAGMTADDFRRLFGVGTDRFLISSLDVT